jgi:hypothetical protein
MSLLLLLKEGGSLDIDTIGNKPIDEDLDLLPDTGAGGSLSNFHMLFYGSSMFIISSIVPGPSTTIFVNGKTRHFYSLNGKG